MCNIWQNKSTDLDLREWHKHLSDRLLRDVSYVGITGGEPLLYSDLPQFAAMVCGMFSLETLHLNTSGLYPDRLENYLKLVSDLRGIRFVVAISLDGIESHDLIRGIPKAFDKAVESVKLSKKYDIETTINSVITTQTPDEINRLEALAKDLGVVWNVTPAYNRDDLRNRAELFQLANDTEAELKEIYRRKTGNIKSKALNQDHLQQMCTGKRASPCSFLDGAAVVMAADGKIYVCQNEFGDDITGNLGTRRMILNATKCETCFSTCLNSLAYRGHIISLMRKTVF